MQGYGYFGADDTMTEAESVAQYAYALLQAGHTPEAVASLQTSSSAAVRAQACQIMATTAATDADKTMAGKVSSVCSGAASHSAAYLLWAATGVLAWYAYAAESRSTARGREFTGMGKVGLGLAVASAVVGWMKY